MSDVDEDGVFLTFIFYFFGMLWAVLLIIAAHKKAQKKSRKKVQRLIEKRQSFFEARGLRWNLPTQFPSSIELWRDYKTQPNYQFPPMNPMNCVIPMPRHEANYFMNSFQPLNPPTNLNFQHQPNLVANPKPQNHVPQLNTGLYEPLVMKSGNEENLYPNLNN